MSGGLVTTREGLVGAPGADVGGRSGFLIFEASKLGGLSGGFKGGPPVTVACGAAAGLVGLFGAASPLGDFAALVGGLEILGGRKTGI